MNREFIATGGQEANREIGPCGSVYSVTDPPTRGCWSVGTIEGTRPGEYRERDPGNTGHRDPENRVVIRRELLN